MIAAKYTAAARKIKLKHLARITQMGKDDYTDKKGDNFYV